MVQHEVKTIFFPGCLSGEKYVDYLSDYATVSRMPVSGADSSAGAISGN
jgi:hypothetical protein